MPVVLVPLHGPFVWGSGPAEAVKNSIALETIAKMATHILTVCRCSQVQSSDRPDGWQTDFR
ncbi:MAG: class II aldolase/adducin family protein [Deltaproteobacteria bacterium]|nr:class II aldolase/adducin family protein [Deltaproteobacteria bacterium]MBW2086174.1 class II aldolase/adducin family protein [Deltaproteobacteria bacterium]